MTITDWSPVSLDFYYGDYHIKANVQYMRVQPWKGSAYDCPSDLDWSGYDDYCVDDFKVLVYHESDDLEHEIDVEDLESIGIPDDAIWEQIGYIEQEQQEP